MTTIHLLRHGQPTFCVLVWFFEALCIAVWLLVCQPSAAIAFYCQLAQLSATQSLPACATGVSLAMVSAAYGCKCFIAMPDDAAIEKAQMLQALGAAGVARGPWEETLYVCRVGIDVRSQ